MKSLYYPILPNEYYISALARNALLDPLSNMLISMKRFGVSMKHTDSRQYIRHRELSIVNNAFKCNTDIIIKNHTFAQFVQSVFPKNQSNIDLNLECKFSKSMSLPYYGWRWCPHCIEEDLKDHQIPYFHRDHQIQGVLFCYKHGTPIISHCEKCGFFIKNLSGVYVLPPLNNICPICLQYITAPEISYDHLMMSIQKDLIACSRGHLKINISEYCDLINDFVGVNLNGDNTVARNRGISNWKHTINRYLDPYIGKHYFGIDLIIDGKANTKSVLSNRALYNPAQQHRPFHPLIYIILKHFFENPSPLYDSRRKGVRQ